MGKEVAVNISEIRAGVNKLRGSLTGLHTKFNAKQGFKNTNIPPFTADLETVNQSMELLEKYRLLLEEDSEVLSDTAETMRENDEQLARRNNSVRNEPQRLHV